MQEGDAPIHTRLVHTVQPVVVPRVFKVSICHCVADSFKGSGYHPRPVARCDLPVSILQARSTDFH
jgi:hypothetical protein